MHATTLLTGFLAAVKAAAAAEPVNTALNLRANFALAEAPLPTAAIARRDDPTSLGGVTLSKPFRQDCTQMVNMALQFFPPGVEAISWAAENMEEPLFSPCTLTVPANISSEWNAIQSSASEFLATIEDKAAKTTNCGIENYNTTVVTTNLCPQSRTYYYTGSSDTTATSVFPPFPSLKGTVIMIGRGDSKPSGEATKSGGDAGEPKDDEPEGAAVRGGNMMGASIAMVAFVAFMIVI